MTGKKNNGDSRSASGIQLKLSQAVAFHQSGMIDNAQILYEEIIRAEPSHFDAIHLLGVIAAQKNNPSKAIRLIGRAIEIYPKNALSHFNLAIALNDLKKHDETIASYKKAISLKPDYAEAHFNLGVLFQNTEKFELAKSSYERSIFYRANYVEAFNNLGAVLLKLEKKQDALACLDKALSLKPDFAEAYNNKGIALRELNDLEGSLACIDKAIALNEHFAEAYNNKGETLINLKKPQDALENFQKAIEIRPDYAEAFHNMGVAHYELGQLDHAMSFTDKALTLKPNFVEAYITQGKLFKERNQFDAAIDSYDQAIKIDPENAQALTNKSILLLLLGQILPGWQLYEWRWRNDSLSALLEKRSFSQPLWLGDFSLENKTILLHGEQGLGDTIQFCRYAKWVAKMGARILLEVQKPLAGLLAQLEGVSQIIPKGEPIPDFDCHCPLMSLPLAFKTDLDNMPSADPYIRASEEKMHTWRERIGHSTKPRIGLVWSGNPLHRNDANRSIPLASLLAYLPPGFHYVSLQKEVRDSDSDVLDAYPEISHFGDALIDFTDTAALCQLVDLVISVDTSLAHLSGSMGKETWVLLPFIPDWRWLLDRTDSPWYSKMRLFRQDKIGNWNDVLKRINEDLINRFS